MFASVEDGIKVAINLALGKKVKEVETHPGRWGDAVIKKMLRAAPAVYVGFSQGGFKELGTDNILSVWNIYVVAKSLNGRREPGVYQLIEKVLVALHELDLDQVDVLRFKQVKNLFSFAQAEQGFSCYELVFELPMAFGLQQVESGQGSDDDIASIDRWARYEAIHTDNNDQVLAIDQVEIKQ